MSADVAIVVPIYNVEEYLEECIYSLVTQSVFSQTQLVLVDDGSTDSSAEIAARYAESYENIVLLRKPNGGLGDARNHGLGRVDAEYVTFVDSDDVVPPGAIGALLDAARGHGSDLVIGNMVAFPKTHRWRWSGYFSDLEEPRDVLLVDFPELIHGSSVCNKLFRVDRLREARLTFGVGVAFEDAYVSLPYMCSARKITLIPDTVYLYRQRIRGGSIMDSRFTDPSKPWDMVVLAERLQAQRVDFPDDVGRLLDAFCVWGIQGDLVGVHEIMAAEDARAFLMRARDALSQVAPETIFGAASGLKHRVAFYALRNSDFDLVAAAAELHLPLMISQGRPAVKVAIDGEFRPELTRLGRSSAWLEYASIDDRTAELEVVGTIDLAGVTLDASASGLSPRLVFDGADGKRRSVSVTLRVRPESKRPGEDWSLFEARVPLAKVRDGEFRLRLKMSDGTESFGLRLRAMTGLYRSPFSTSRDGRLYELVKDRSNGALVNLRVGSSSPRARLVRAARRLADPEAKGSQRARLVIRALVRARRPLTLVGERRDTAQDNGFALFRHMRSDTQYRRRSYYILDRSSADWGEARALGHVVAHGSLRHKFLMLRSTHLVSSQDIDSYLFPEDWDRKQIRRVLSANYPWKRVFLQHGVTMSGVGPALRRGVTGLDLLVTAATEETAYLRATCRGYTDEIRMLGFPRFDRLRGIPAKPRVLVAPTWRSWLVDASYRVGEGKVKRDLFEGSDFKAHFDEILGSARLADVLERSGYTLLFYPHYEFRKYYSDYEVASPRVRIHDNADVSFGELLASSRVFVTDYSSTHFDAAYAGASVIYTPFDEEEFMEGHYAAGWFSAREHGFGPVAKTPAEVIDAIEAAIAHEGHRDPVYEERVRSTLGMLDSDNGARVAKAVFEL